MKNEYTTFIVLLAVDEFDRRKHAEMLENTTFDSWIDFGKKLTAMNALACYDNVYIKTLSDFVDDCNDEEVVLSDTWITYIRVKSADHDYSAF